MIFIPHSICCQIDENQKNAHSKANNRPKLKGLYQMIANVIDAVWYQ